MSSDVAGGLHSWSLQSGVTLALIVVALAYLRGWYRIWNARSNTLPVSRLAAFMAGVLSLWAAMGSPLALLDHQLLTVHMVQHLSIMTVAAPLILLGAPVITLLNGIRQDSVSVQRPFLRYSFVHRLECIVGHSVFCWLASAAAVIGWHVPALFELGLRSEFCHEVEHLCFFVAGLLFWWPVVQPWGSVRRSRWSVPVYLFLATLPCDALSAFLTFCNRVVYPHYVSSHRAFSISPLADQELAGALMWVFVTFAYLAPAVVVTIKLLSPSFPQLGGLYHGQPRFLSSIRKLKPPTTERAGNDVGQR